MKRRLFLDSLGVLGVGRAICAPVFGAENQARRLDIIRPYNYPGLKEFQIDLPGRYFLAEDHIQRKYHFARGGRILRVTGGMMIDILCGDVDLDLRGHTLGADAEMSGIMFSPKNNERYAKFLTGKHQQAALNGKNVSIRNGIVDLARGEDTGSGITLSNMWRDSIYRTFGRPVDMEAKEKYYKKNNFRLKDLHVLAKMVAVEVEGNFTIIKNCTIESEDVAAIFSAGSNVLIEGCNIRLRRTARKNGVPRAAIVLRDGFNAIIRNNTIRVDHKRNEDTTYGILVRDGATNVLIENNVFVNAGANPVMLAEGARATMRGNKAESTWF